MIILQVEETSEALDRQQGLVGIAANLISTPPQKLAASVSRLPDGPSSVSGGTSRLDGLSRFVAADDAGVLSILISKRRFGHSFNHV